MHLCRYASCRRVIRISNFGVRISFSLQNSAPLHCGSNGLANIAPVSFFDHFSAPLIGPGSTIGILGSGQLEPQIGLEVSWRDLGAAVAALRDRKVNGKAVLRFD